MGRRYYGPEAVLHDRSDQAGGEGRPGAHGRACGVARLAGKGGEAPAHQRGPVPRDRATAGSPHPPSGFRLVRSVPCRTRRAGSKGSTSGDRPREALPRAAERSRQHAGSEAHPRHQAPGDHGSVCLVQGAPRVDDSGCGTRNLARASPDGTARRRAFRHIRPK